MWRRYVELSLVVFTVISFVSTCSEKDIITKLSHVHKNKGVGDKGSLMTDFKFLFGRSFVPLIRPFDEDGRPGHLDQLYMAK